MNQHPCEDRCPNFTNEQCCHCLIQDIEKQEFHFGVAPDEQYTKGNKYLKQAMQSIEEIS